MATSVITQSANVFSFPEHLVKTDRYRQTDMIRVTYYWLKTRGTAVISFQWCHWQCNQSVVIIFLYSRQLFNNDNYREVNWILKWALQKPVLLIIIILDNIYNITNTVARSFCHIKQWCGNSQSCSVQ